jgi:hypothetical protein
MLLRRSVKVLVLVTVGLVAAGALAASVLLFVYGETNGTLVSSGETRHYLSTYRNPTTVLRQRRWSSACMRLV